MATPKKVNKKDSYSESEFVTFALPGEKLPKTTNDISLISKFGMELVRTNRDFIKEKVQNNWFSVVDPVNGIIIASEDPFRLFEYTKKEYPNRVFYFSGLIKNLFNYVRHN